MNQQWAEAFGKARQQQKQGADAAASMPHGGNLAKGAAQREAASNAKLVAATADAKRGSRLSAISGCGWPFPDSFFPFGIEEKRQQQQLQQLASTEGMQVGDAFAGHSCGLSFPLCLCLCLLPPFGFAVPTCLTLDLVFCHHRLHPAVAAAAQAVAAAAAAAAAARLA